MLFEKAPELTTIGVILLINPVSSNSCLPLLVEIVACNLLGNMRGLIELPNFSELESRDHIVNCGAIV